MNFELNTSIPLITVFLQGILSFLSPCVLPLLPVYLGYLAGGKSDKESHRPILNSLCFIIGISFTFFLLGFGFTALGKFFESNRTLFAQISGIIMILFGVYQLGIFGKFVIFEKERRLPFLLDSRGMGPWVAFILGFTFSFAWTPCVGPILGSVVLMAGTSSTFMEAAGFIGVYVLGFGIPFLLVGIFTNHILDFFKKKRNILKYTVKLAAVLMIFMGIMTFTGVMSQGTDTAKSAQKETTSNRDQEQNKQKQEAKENVVPVPDFTLTDQNGMEHSIADYKGKVVFLNFWATWCPPCRGELPDIQKLYEEYGENAEDVIILGIAGPNFGREGSTEEIQKFLTDNQYSYPVLMDEGGSLFQTFGISSFPTTYMIDVNGNIYGQMPGAMTEDTMKKIVEQTKASQDTDKDSES